MRISFQTKKMAKKCSSEQKMRAEWGTKMAKKLKLRLEEMAAAESLEDLRSLPMARCHELKGDRKGQLTVDVADPYRLVFVPDHDPIPTKEDGGLDWSAVTAVTVLEVGDPH